MDAFAPLLPQKLGFRPFLCIGKHDGIDVCFQRLLRAEKILRPVPRRRAEIGPQLARGNVSCMAENAIKDIGGQLLRVLLLRPGPQDCTDDGRDIAVVALDQNAKRSGILRTDTRECLLIGHAINSF